MRPPGQGRKEQRKEGTEEGRREGRKCRPHEVKWGEVDGTIISEIFIWTRIHREGGGKRLFRIVTRGEVTEHLSVGNLAFADMYYK